jgi:hypothetical protein
MKTSKTTNSEQSLFIHIYLELVSELKSSNESMIKTSKTTNSDYGNKVFPEIKVFFSHTPLKLHVLQLYNGPHLFLFSKDIPQQK